MGRNHSLVEFLTNLLLMPADQTELTIKTALDDLCALVQARGAAVYQRSGPGDYQAVYHPSSGRSATLPGRLPDRVVSAWTDNRDMHLSRPASGGGFAPGGAAATAPLKPCHGEGFILLAMMEAGRLAGAVGFEGAEGGTAFSDSQIALMREATDILQIALSRRQAEMRQAETLRKHEAVLAALPDQLFEVDADGRFTGFFAGPPLLIGDPAKSLAGRTLASALPADIAPILSQVLHDTMEKGAVHGRLLRLEAAGVARHLELSCAACPLAQSAGNPSVIFAVRNATRDAWMHDDRLPLVRIFGSMDNLVAVLDAQMCVVWVNAAFEIQTGWRLEEIRGKRLGTVVRSPESAPETVARVNEAIRNRTAFRGEMINQDRHGNRYWVDFNILPLLDGEGGLKGYVSIETDVTKFKAQEIAMAGLAAAAEAANSRLTNAIHALTDCVVVFDADERLVAVNAAYLRAFPEIAPQAVAGASLRDLLRAGLAKSVFLAGASEAEKEAWLSARVADYQKPHAEDEVQLPDGRWLRRVSTRTSDGGFVAMGIDITEERGQIAAMDAANRAMQQVLADRDLAEQQRNRIIEAAAVGTWELDVSCGILDVGGRWGEILGLATSRLAGLTVSEFLAMVHPDDHSRLYRPGDFGPVPDAEIINSEIRMRHRDGHWVWILSRFRVTQRSADGTASRIAGVHLDISERKQLEREVAASRAFLLEVMDSSATAIVVLDGSDKVTFATEEAARLLGMRDKFELGDDFDIAALKLERADGGALLAGELPFALVRRAKGPVRDIEYALRRPDGSRRVVSCDAAPLASVPDTRHGQSGIVITFRDITENLAATARLEEALARAEEMSQTKSTFLANMSHEIRTPLNGVLGMAEVLADIVVEPVQRQMVATIRKSGETLLTVLNGILDMSKIEAGMMQLEVVPFVPMDLIRQLEAIYTIAAEEKGLEFEVLASAGCDRPRLGDPHRLMQILNNLLNNAIKFTGSGKVTLKLSCRPGKPVLIEVIDTGIGMDPSQATRIFESFEQADGSITRRFGGTGLGLSIVRQLATLMGGEISAESTAGQGSRFRVTLPMPETEILLPVGTVAKDGLPQEDTLAGVRILAADDNATNRLVLTEMLAKTGAVVTQAENGKEAIEAWTDAQDSGAAFALLLLDITMPVLDGMSALAEIRAAEKARGLPPVPAIAVTANAMPSQVADYIVAGFDTHLAKPFRRGDLQHAILSLLST